MRLFTLFLVAGLLVAAYTQVPESGEQEVYASSAEADFDGDEDQQGVQNSEDHGSSEEHADDHSSEEEEDDAPAAAAAAVVDGPVEEDETEVAAGVVHIDGHHGHFHHDVAHHLPGCKRRFHWAPRFAATKWLKCDCHAPARKAYACGFAKGQAIGYHNGFHNGKHVGFGAGLCKGKKIGYHAGFFDGQRKGYLIGSIHGARKGHCRGIALGKRIGVRFGLRQGWISGKKTGLSHGFHAGIRKGHCICNRRIDELKRRIFFRHFRGCPHRHGHFGGYFYRRLY